MSDVAVRRGSAADLAATAEIWTTATDARRAAIGLPASTRPESYEDDVRQRLSDPARSIFVAEAGDEVVGMAISMPAIENEGTGTTVVPGLLHVSSVAVRPDHWGRGIGAALMTAVLERAREQGYRRAQLWTHETNVAAHALYRRGGFHPSERAKIDDNGELIRRWDLDLHLGLPGQ